jgi:hypothetical protein
MPSPLLWVHVQVMSGMLVAPRVPEAAERLEMSTLVDTCCSPPWTCHTCSRDARTTVAAPNGTAVAT